MIILNIHIIIVSILQQHICNAASMRYYKSYYVYAKTLFHCFRIRLSRSLIGSVFNARHNHNPNPNANHSVTEGGRSESDETEFWCCHCKIRNFTADTNNPAWEHVSSFGWGLASSSKKSNAIRSTSTIRLLCQSALSPNPHDGLCFYTQLLPKACKAMWHLCLYIKIIADHGFF